MSEESLEKRLKKLEDTFEQKVASLEREVQRAQAVTEIQNLMNRMQYLHGAGRDPDIADAIFAQKKDDVRLHFGEQGYWEGIEGIRNIGNMTYPGGSSRVGRMGMHLMLQPVIEVAGDAQTAKAIFWAMGLRAFKDNETGEPMAVWEWNRYHDDYVKEDGKWKLWHHHVYPLLNIGYDEKWADQFKEKEGGGGLQFPEDTKPYYHPPTPDDVGYDPDSELPYLSPPVPYETWDPEKSY